VREALLPESLITVVTVFVSTNGLFGLRKHCFPFLFSHIVMTKMLPCFQFVSCFQIFV